MATNATIVSVWQDAQCAYMAVSVAGEASVAAGVNIEYIGSVPLAALVGLTLAQKKAALVAAVKAVRDAQVSPTTSIGITGTVSI